MIAMADLKAMFAKSGFRDARTLLQSGNVVFDGGRRSSGSLEKLLEAEIKKRFKLPIDVMVRTSKEWQEVINRNPFGKEAKGDPSHLLVNFAKGGLDAAAVRSLAAGIKGPEVIQAVGSQLYTYYPDGVGRSKLTNAVIEKTLKTRVTARNWNTIQKLAALLAD